MYLPSIEAVKDQAKRLRDTLSDTGQNIGHSQALELMARQYGYKDWNTFHAKLGNQQVTTPFKLGQHVSGTYLGKRFTGEVLALRKLSGHDRFRISLKFDKPVDVVDFDSFSSFRHRISSTIGLDGKTVEKTSNGKPQLQLDL